MRFSVSLITIARGLGKRASRASKRWPGYSRNVGWSPGGLCS